MPEELPVENGGAVEATQTQTQPDTDWQKRYTDTQAWGNTLNEQITSLKSDPTALVQFLQQHHPDLLEDEEVEEEPEFEPDEADRPLTRAEFESWKAEQSQQAQAKTQAERFEADLKACVNDRDLDPRGEKAIRYALSQGEIRNPDDLKKAVDDWFEFADARASKPKPRVPHVPSNGTAATGQPNWGEMTPGEINKYLVERVRADQAQT